MLGLVLGAWLWGIFTLGAHHAMAAQTPPPMANTSRGTWWSRALVRRAPRKESGRWAVAMAEPAGVFGRSAPT